MPFSPFWIQLAYGVHLKRLFLERRQLEYVAVVYSLEYSLAMIHIVLAFAEFERDMIVTRTQEGKKYAKLHNKNYREGRPKRVITPKYRMIYEYKTSGHSYTETAKAFEVSKSTIQRIVKQVESEKEAIE